MTLGATPSPNDVVAELGVSYPFTFPNAVSRWLADVGVSDPLEFPTSFVEKTSVKIVDTAQTGGANSTGNGTHTFTGVNFGAAFPDRVLIACIGLHLGASVTLDQSSCTIGGEAAVGDDSGRNVTSSACGAGVWAAVVSDGTSGDITINWSGGSVAKVGMILLSVSGISTTPHGETTSWNTATTGDTKTLDIPDNGLLVAAFAHGDTNDTTMTGVTKRQEITFTTSGGGANLCVGFDNRLNAVTGSSVGVSWSGSSSPGGGEARSYSQ